MTTPADTVAAKHRVLKAPTWHDHPILEEDLEGGISFREAHNILITGNEVKTKWGTALKLEPSQAVKPAVEGYHPDQFKATDVCISYEKLPCLVMDDCGGCHHAFLDGDLVYDEADKTKVVENSLKIMYDPVRVFAE